MHLSGEGSPTRLTGNAYVNAGGRPPTIHLANVAGLRLMQIEHSQNTRTGTVKLTFPSLPPNVPQHLLRLEADRAARFYARLARYLLEE